MYASLQVSLIFDPVINIQGPCKIGIPILFGTLLRRPVRLTFPTRVSDTNYNYYGGQKEVQSRCGFERTPTSDTNLPRARTRVFPVRVRVFPDRTAFRAGVSLINYDESRRGQVNMSSNKSLDSKL